MDEGIRAYVPPHLILEILSWLPPEAIIRFRSVCKSWFSMLADSPFILQHRFHYGNFKKNNTTSRIIIPTAVTSAQVGLTDYNAGIDNTTTVDRCCCRIIGSCNGLFGYAIGSGNQWSIMLCNPSIRRIITLPPCPVLKDITLIAPINNFGLGFDIAVNDYKVVVISVGKAVIFSLKSNSWRIIQGVVPDTVFVEFPNKSVYLHGFIHWFGYRCDGFVSKCLIVFDVSNEVFGHMKLPSRCRMAGPLHQRPKLSVLKGELCVMTRGVDESWEVWTMKEYGVDSSWGLLFEVWDLAGQFYANAPFAKVIYCHVDIECCIKKET